MTPDHRETQGIGVGVGERTAEDHGEAPTEALRQELRKQATPGVLHRASKLARTCAERIAARGGACGALRASELVYDALGDTWLGTVCWDPRRKTLEQHLADTVSWRARHAVRRSARVVFLGTMSYGDDPEDDNNDQPIESSRRASIWATLQVAPLQEGPDDSASRFLKVLLREAKGDVEVTAILHALQRHTSHVRRAAMAAVPGMTLKRFHAAKARLMYLAKRLAAGAASEPQAASEGRTASPMDQEDREPMSPASARGVVRRCQGRAHEHDQGSADRSERRPHLRGRARPPVTAGECARRTRPRRWYAAHLRGCRWSEGTQRSLAPRWTKHLYPS